jgi:hypothetical protein
MRRGTLTLVVLSGFAVAGLLQADDEEYPKLAPFSAVRWKEAVPEVRVNSEVWYQLLELNGLPADKIVAFCKETYGDRWQKRFEEDLVEVLSKMNHTPGEAVTLKVLDLKSKKTTALDKVPMTKENRRALWQARKDREEQP